MVRGQVVGQYAEQLEAVAQLEAQGQIAKAVLAHRLDIRLRAAELLHAPGEARQAPTEHDAAQAELLAQALAAVVETPADAQATVLGVHAYLHAVQPIALGVVPRGMTATGDFAPAVPVQGHFFGDAERGAVTDHGTFVERDELPFRELRQQSVALLQVHHLRPDSRASG